MFILIESHIFSENNLDTAHTLYNIGIIGGSSNEALSLIVAPFSDATL